MTWRKESERHSLASKGIRTKAKGHGGQSTSYQDAFDVYNENVLPLLNFLKKEGYEILFLEHPEYEGNMIYGIGKTKEEALDEFKKEFKKYYHVKIRDIKGFEHKGVWDTDLAREIYTNPIYYGAIWF